MKIVYNLEMETEKPSLNVSFIICEKESIIVKFQKNLEIFQNMDFKYGKNVTL